VKSNVPVVEAIDEEVVLPGRVQEALGELVGAAKEGLLALSVEVGLGVLRELLESEVEEVVGPKGTWNRERTAVRHGHENREVTLGGRRVPGADDHERVRLDQHDQDTCATSTPSSAFTAAPRPSPAPGGSGSLHLPVVAVDPL
jgi:hypothetical protein